ncbi:hypothetical protein D3C85_1945400 [compost metagenome]
MNTLKLTSQIAGTLIASIRLASGFLALVWACAGLPLSKNQVSTPAAMSISA